MTDVQGLTRALTELKPSRRTVLVAAAWTAPAVMGLSAVPAAAASGGDEVRPAGTLYNATWSILGAGELQTGQSGMTGWTQPEAGIYRLDDGTATSCDWLDLGSIGPGFLSGRDAGDDPATIQVDFAYLVQPGQKDQVSFVIRSDNDGSATQLLDVELWAEDSRLVAFGYTTQTDPEDDSGYLQLDDGVIATPSRPFTPYSTTVTVRLIFTLPKAGAAANLWVKEPLIRPR